MVGFSSTLSTPCLDFLSGYLALAKNDAYLLYAGLYF